MRRTTLTAALLLLAGSACAAAPASDTVAAASAPSAATAMIAIAPATTLAPEPRQVLIGRTVVQVMQAHHYPAKKLDQDLALAVLKQYFDELDPGRFYFTQADIDRLTGQYGTGLAEDLKHGNLNAAFAIYNDYIDRAHARLHAALDLLDRGYRFDGNGQYHFYRRHVPWPKSSAALDTLWRERVDNDLLSLVLDGQSQKEAKQTLIRRYRYALNHINRTTANDVFDTWMNAYAQTRDPHSSYFSPFDAQQFQIQMSLQLEGIGAQLTKHGNYVTIVRILTGGPAAKSKTLASGDRIVAVGQGKSGEMVDVIGWRLDDVVKLIRGAKGSTVRLRILPAGALPGGSERILELVRDTIELNAERASAEVRTIEQGTVAYRIGIITIPSFYINFEAEGNGDKRYTSVSRDVRALIEKLKKEQVSGILLDLRNNGGGSLQEALSLTGLFIPDGPVVQVRERGGDNRILSTPHGETPVWLGPLAILDNRFSASATEIFAGAMKDYRRALIIGSRTWGKGTVQQLVKLEPYLPGFRAGELKLTTAQFFRVNGSSTQHRGIVPDIAIPNAIDDARFGESSYPNALPWKQIEPADYKPMNKSIVKLLPKLLDYYTTTIQKEPLFVLYLKSVKAELKQSERTEIPLNIETRKALRDARRSERLTLINAWRQLAGDPPFDDLPAAEKTQFVPPDVPLEISTQILGRYIDEAPPSVAVHFHFVHPPKNTPHTTRWCLNSGGEAMISMCSSKPGEDADKTLHPPAPASSP